MNMSVYNYKCKGGLFVTEYLTHAKVITQTSWCSSCLFMSMLSCDKIGITNHSLENLKIVPWDDELAMKIAVHHSIAFFSLCFLFFFVLFCFGLAHGMHKFLGQRSNLRHGSGSAESLACCTTRELHPSVVFLLMYMCVCFNNIILTGK